MFAFSGSLVAARRGLDIVGLFVLALAAGTAGGVIRDVLIGATPPAALVLALRREGRSPLENWANEKKKPGVLV